MVAFPRSSEDSVDFWCSPVTDAFWWLPLIVYREIKGFQSEVAACDEPFTTPAQMHQMAFMEIKIPAPKSYSQHAQLSGRFTKESSCRAEAAGTTAKASALIYSSVSHVTLTFLINDYISTKL